MTMNTERLTLVNPTDACWTRHRYILAFGAYGDTLLMVWASSLDAALDEAVDWIADHAPGLLADEAVAEEYAAAIAEGFSHEDAVDRAEVDTTTAGNASHYINAWEWSVVAEDPDRATILAVQGRPTVPGFPNLAQR